MTISLPLLVIATIICSNIEGVIGFDEWDWGAELPAGGYIRVDFAMSEFDWFLYIVNVSSYPGTVSVYVLPTNEVDNCLSRSEECATYYREDNVSSAYLNAVSLSLETISNTFLIFNNYLPYDVLVDWRVLGYHSATSISPPKSATYVLMTSTSSTIASTTSTTSTSTPSSTTSSTTPSTTLDVIMEFISGLTLLFILCLAFNVMIISAIVSIYFVKRFERMRGERDSMKLELDDLDAKRGREETIIV